MVKKWKIITLFFLFSIAVTWIGLQWIQSQFFAQLVSHGAAHWLDHRLGVEARFQSLSIQAVPLTFQFKNPQLVLKRSLLDGPKVGTSVLVETLEVRLHLLHLLMGRVKLKSISLLNGKVKLLLDDQYIKQLVQNNQQQDKKKDHSEHFISKISHELSFILGSFSLDHVQVEVVPEVDQKYYTQFDIDRFHLHQWVDRYGIGYQGEIHLKKLKSEVFNIGKELEKEIHDLSFKYKFNPHSFFIRDLWLKLDQIDFKSNFYVQGDLSHSWKPEVEVTLEAHYPSLKNYLTPFIQLPGEWVQDISIHAKLNADLQSDWQTWSSDFYGKFKNICLNQWCSDDLEIEGALNPKKETHNSSSDSLSKQGHEDPDAESKVSTDQMMDNFDPWIKNLLTQNWVVKKVQLTSVHKKRSLDGPASGGKVMIGPVVWPPKEAFLNVPVQLQSAHLHWLLGPHFQSVYPLQFLVNGSVELKMNDFWSNNNKIDIQGKTDLKINQFQLDNQSLNQEKPLSKIFSMDQLNISGDFQVNTEKFVAQTLKLIVQQTELDIRGHVDFQQGYQLQGMGYIHLSELGHIADIPIDGEGSVNLSIHGPASRVLVSTQLNLQDTTYLDLFLGDIKGQIVWNDAINRLSFNDIQGKVNQTDYQVDGLVDLGDNEKVHLDVQFHRAQIQDVVKIFKNPLKVIPWFPQSLEGSLQGTAKVRGKTSWDQMQILGEIDGEMWRYLDESIQKVHLLGGYHYGRYSINSFDFKKRYGQLSGSLEYDSQLEYIQWDIVSKNMLLNDLDHIAKMDVPFHGKMLFKSRGRGVMDAIESTTLFEIGQFSIRGHQFPKVWTYLKTKNGYADLTSQIFGQQANLKVHYDLRQKRESSFNFKMNHLNFTPLLVILNPQLIYERSLKGLMTGSLSFDFIPGKKKTVDGLVRLDQLSIYKGDAHWKLKKSVESTLVKDYFSLDKIQLDGLGKTLDMQLKGDITDIKGKITGKIDLGFAEVIVPWFKNTKGFAQLNLDLSNTLFQPHLSGSVNIPKASGYLSDFEASFNDVESKIYVNKNLFKVKHCTGLLGGGNFNLSGQVDAYQEKGLKLNLSSKLSDVKLKIFPMDFVQLSGDIELEGEQAPYLVHGTLVSSNGLSKEKFLNRNNSMSSFGVPQYMLPITRRVSNDLRLQVSFLSHEGLFLDNDLFRKVEMVTKLKFMNTVSMPHIVGDIKVKKGALFFKDHEFEIDSGIVTFTESTALNPYVELKSMI